MVITATTVKDVVRRIDRGLRQGEVVANIPFHDIVLIRLPVTPKSRMTPAGIARRLLVEIRRHKVTRFLEPELPPIERVFRASTKRVSVRAYEDYDVRKDRLLVWWDVLGARSDG